MLGKPSQSLRRRILLAGDVRSRRGEFQGQRIAVVGTGDRVFPETGNVEFRPAESLALGDVHHRIQVQDVGRRAVGLVADEGTVSMGPFRPGSQEILLKHLTETFPVIAHGPDIPLRILGTGQFRDNVVTIPFPKEFRQLLRPVGAVYFVGIIEKDGWPGGSGGAESPVEAVQVEGDGFLVIMVHDQAFPARGGPFHLLTGRNRGDGPVFPDGHLLGRVTLRDAGTAERPSGSTVHVHFQPQPFRFGTHVPVHLHPLRRQVVDVVGLVPLHAIDGCDFHAADSFGGELLQVVGQTFLVHGAAKPPPADERTVLRGRPVPACDGFLARNRKRQG